MCVGHLNWYNAVPYAIVISEIGGVFFLFLFASNTAHLCIALGVLRFLWLFIQISYCLSQIILLFYLSSRFEIYV